MVSLYLWLTLIPYLFQESLASTAVCPSFLPQLNFNIALNYSSPINISYPLDILLDSQSNVIIVFYDSGGKSVFVRMDQSYNILWKFVYNGYVLPNNVRISPDDKSLYFLTSSSICKVDISNASNISITKSIYLGGNYLMYQ